MGGTRVALRAGSSAPARSTMPTSSDTTTVRLETECRWRGYGSRRNAQEGPEAAGDQQAEAEADQRGHHGHDSATRPGPRSSPGGGSPLGSAAGPARGALGDDDGEGVEDQERAHQQGDEGEGEQGRAQEPPGWSLTGGMSSASPGGEHLEPTSRAARIRSRSCSGCPPRRRRRSRRSGPRGSSPPGRWAGRSRPGGPRRGCRPRRSRSRR